MTVRIHVVFAIPVLFPSCMSVPMHPAQAAIVLRSDATLAVDPVLVDGEELWVAAEDLLHINAFELKPQGLCRDDTCLLVDGEGGRLLRSDADRDWINLTGLARALDQPYVVDREASVWSFDHESAHPSSDPPTSLAPDFALPDRDGRLVRLSDLRGRKVLLLTWASW